MMKLDVAVMKQINGIKYLYEEQIQHIKEYMYNLGFENNESNNKIIENTIQRYFRFINGKYLDE